MNSFINRFRGLLAILVATGHASAICAGEAASPDQLQAALTPVLMFTGFNYVIGFIVISGYCIARSTGNKEFALAEYLWSRSTRIYPSLVACGLLAGLVDFNLLQSSYRVEMWSGSVNAASFLYTLLGAGGFAGTFGSYAPTYTVSLELFFYLLWGLAVASLPRKLAVPICLVAVPALFAVLPSRFQFAVVLFLVWLIGAAISVFEAPLTRLSARVPLWATWLIALVSFIYGNAAVSKFGVNIWSFPGSLATIPCGLLFGAVILGHLARRGQGLSLDDWLGEISYPLFLCHGPVIIAGAAVARMIHSHTSFGAMLLGLMVSSFVVAHLVAIAIERALMRWRHSRRTALSADRPQNIAVAAMGA